MKKIQKTAIIYLIIFVQSVLAIIAGASAVHSFSDRKLPKYATAGMVDIGSLSVNEAESRIDKFYSDMFKNKKLNITVNKDKGNFEIPYSDFETAVDSKATVASVFDTSKSTVFTSFKNEFSTSKVSVKPVINVNEGKLIQQLVKLAGKMDKTPVSATLYYENGKIIRKPEQDGQKLNIEKAVDKIRSHIAEDPSAELNFSRFDNRELETVQPMYKLRDLEELDTIIAEYSTELIYPEFTDALKWAAAAVNGAVIQPADNKDSKPVPFSFVKFLKENDESFENDNEGYDQAASTLYAAVLAAGIDKGSITRIPHEIPVDYIAPGLDAWISGNGGEFKFSNTLRHKIAILANIEDNRLVIRIAGNTEDKKEASAAGLKVEVVERFSPPVMNVESSNLKKGEKIVLDQGKEGIRVKVYRNSELVSEDKYEAVKKVVQIGPGTEWTGAETDK